MNVLHIEDNPADVCLVEDLLDDADNEDFTLYTVGTMADAQGLLTGDSPLPDVIMLDVGLPDTQGIDSLKAILEVCADIPVVVLTGLKDPELGREAVRLGAEDYLAKDELTAPGFLSRTLRYAYDRSRRQRHSLRRAVSAGVEAGHKRALDEDLFAALPAELLRTRNPSLFSELVFTYVNQLSDLDLSPTSSIGESITQRRTDHLVRQLAAAEATPADLADVHSVAVRTYTAENAPHQPDVFPQRAQALLLTLMGRVAVLQSDIR